MVQVSTVNLEKKLIILNIDFSFYLGETKLFIALKYLYIKLSRYLSALYPSFCVFIKYFELELICEKNEIMSNGLKY